MKRKVISALLVGAMAMSAFSVGAMAAENAVADASGLADKEFDTSYQPAKDKYSLYFTYKLVHAWYDAIEVGVKGAVADLAEKGVEVDYEWYAPVNPDAQDQVNSIETAIGQGWDMILVDVNQEALTQAAVNEATQAGIPVGLFASADLPDTDRAFFVGNNDNYGDGASIARATYEKMLENGKTQVAFLAGTIGATSHESRLQAFKDVAEEYPEIEIVDEQRDNDFVEEAITITEAWLSSYPELGGILCNNMSNPVGACQAVSDAGKAGEIVIGGMDHDLRTLKYLEDGTLYVACIQNCYDMGYKAVYYAIESLDGVEVPDVTDVGSSLAFQEDAQTYIDILFAES